MSDIDKTIEKIRLNISAVKEIVEPFQRLDNEDGQFISLECSQVDEFCDTLECQLSDLKAELEAVKGELKENEELIGDFNVTEIKNEKLIDQLKTENGELRENNKKLEDRLVDNFTPKTDNEKLAQESVENFRNENQQ